MTPPPTLGQSTRRASGAATSRISQRLPCESEQSPSSPLRESLSSCPGRAGEPPLLRPSQSHAEVVVAPLLRGLLGSPDRLGHPRLPSSGVFVPRKRVGMGHSLCHGDRPAPNGPKSDTQF